MKLIPLVLLVGLTSPAFAQWVVTDPANTAVKGTMVDVNGSATVNVAGGIIKLN